MTSVISFRKLFFHEIRQKAWLLLLSFITFAVTLPVSVLVYVEQNKFYYAASPAEIEEMKHMLRGFLTYRNFGVKLSVILIAALCGIISFCFLHSREKLDLYNSIPLSRQKYFFVQYISGLVIFLVPYLLGQIGAYLVVFIRGEGFEKMAFYCIAGAVWHILAFLLLYTLAVLAMILTGKTGIGVLAVCVLFFYPAVIQEMTEGLNRIFYASYTENYTYSVMGFMKVLTQKSSAVLGYVQTYEANLKRAVFYLLSAAVVFGIAFACYKKRPSEAAGHALAWQKTESVVKLMVAVPAGILCGAIFREMADGGVWWCIVAGFLSVLVFCCIIEFIYHMELGNIVKRWRSLAAGAMVTAAVFAVYQSDLFGYDDYLPREEDLKAIAVHVPDLENYFGYIGDTAEDMEESGRHFVSASTDKSRGLLYEMAKEGVVHLEENKDKGTKAEENFGETEFVIRYTTGFGRQVLRTYYADGKELLRRMDELCKEPEFRSEIVPMEKLDIEDVSQIRVADTADAEMRETPLRRGAIEEIWKVYLEELKNMTLTDMNSAEVIGKLVTEVVVRKDSEWSYHEFYVYDSMEKTKAALESYDCRLEGVHYDKETRKSILSMELNSFSDEDEEFRWAVDMGDDMMVEQILSHLRDSYYMITRPETSVWVDIKMEDGSLETWEVEEEGIPEAYKELLKTTE